MNSPDSRWGGFDDQPGAASAQIPEIHVLARTVGQALSVGAATLGITHRPLFADYISGEMQARLRATHPHNQDALLVDQSGIYVADGVSSSRNGANASQLVTTEFSSFIGCRDPSKQSPETVVQMAHDAAGHAQKKLRNSEDGGSTTLTALIATNDPNKYIRWTTGDSRSIHGRNGVLLSSAPVQSVILPGGSGTTRSFVANTFTAGEPILHSDGRPSTNDVPPRLASYTNILVDQAKIIEIAPGDTVALYTDGLEVQTQEQKDARVIMDPSIVLEDEMRYPTPEMAARQLMTLPERLYVASRRAGDGSAGLLPAVDDITVAIGRMGVLGQ